MYRPSAEAEPKWNCTANFVAEQLEKLKDMTDEERIKLLHILFPSAEAEPSLKAIKRQIDEHWYLDPPSDEAVSREEYEEVKAYMDTLVDAFIEDGEELAESVKVVRCKDCKHWHIDSHCDGYRSADDFCSWGERKEESEVEE